MSQQGDAAAAGDWHETAEQIAYRRRLDVFLASREVGETLTADALRRGIRLEPVLSGAEAIARYADEALAIVHDEYRPPLECRVGCCYCCCKPGVLATIPEFLRLLHYVWSTFSAQEREALIDRAHQYAGQMAGRSFNDLVDDLVPCPLLVDGRCSVYEVRPLVCRGYNSTNVEACRAASRDATATVPIFAVLKDVTDGATIGVAHALHAVGLDSALVDLGTALAIALPVGDGVSEAVVEGGSMLRPAENASLVPEMWAQVCETARAMGVDAGAVTRSSSR
jgi:Fe-S-cluster containining protein